MTRSQLGVMFTIKKHGRGANKQYFMVIPKDYGDCVITYKTYSQILNSRTGFLNKYAEEV
jgi:hypothetical protein